MTSMRTSKYDRLSDPNAHKALQRLYEERVPRVEILRDGKRVMVPMTQKEFGETYGIGTQGMVWQFLNGRTPLTVEAAAKFARGLRCTIDDISPILAQALKRDILPVLGRAAAVLLAFSFLMASPQADARIEHNISSRSFISQLADLNTHWLTRIRRLIDWLVSLLSCNPLQPRTER